MNSHFLLGGTEKRMNYIFSKAITYGKRIIILLDEFDALLGDVSGDRDSSSSMRGAMTVFQQCLDELIERSDLDVLLVATTNYPTKLPKAQLSLIFQNLSFGNIAV